MPSHSPTLSIAQSLALSATTLREAGLPEAMQESRALYAAVLGMDRAQLLTQAERGLTMAEQTALAAALVRRAAHEPLARIIGQREFWGLNFALNAATLEPRPDSETLIEAALTLMPERQRPWRLLDLGTGSGCLLLALLHEYPHATGLGVDCAAAAVTIAAENAAALGLQERAMFRQADWFAADFTQQLLPMAGAGFDMIISNPPYVATAVVATLARSVRDYDPEAALTGGADGLQAYRRLTAILPALSHAHTHIILEIGYDQGQSVPALFAAAGYKTPALRHDLAGQPRCVITTC
jgi:release factor glutamine methyltransferase